MSGFNYFQFTAVLLLWSLLKVRQSRNVFFKPTILPKNEQKIHSMAMVNVNKSKETTPTATIALKVAP